MEQLLENAREFLESGKENLEKNRLNVSASDDFKSIVIFCDYLIYREIKRLPKNHKDRFSLIEIYFKEIHERVSYFFEVYVRPYNLKVKKEDVLNLEKYANELKEIIRD